MNSNSFKIEVINKVFAYKSYVYNKTESVWNSPKARYANTPNYYIFLIISTK